MATLELGESISLQTPLRKGMVLAFKSQRLDLTPRDFEPTGLQLWNKAGEIVRQILIRRRRDEVVFNARTPLSLLDGWGENETISNIASSWQSTSRFTISVYDCGDNYQILFNLTTVHHFKKRFSINSSAVKATYRQGSDETYAKTLSQSLKVFLYDVNSLPTRERLAVQLAKSPKTVSFVVPARGIIGSAKKLIDTPRIFKVLKWDDELRIYDLGPGNILQDHTHSDGSGNHDWYPGKLHKLGIVLNPDSNLAVIRFFKHEIHPKSGSIQALCHHTSNKGSWVKGPIIAKAVKGSNIAAVVCPRPNGSNRVDAVHLYYQGLDLHLREQVWSPDAGRWVTSSFDVGAQPKGTPISAIVGDGEVHVSWKDAKNRFVTISRSNVLGCGPNDFAEGNGNEQLDGRD